MRHPLSLGGLLNLGRARCAASDARKVFLAAIAAFQLRRPAANHQDVPASMDQMISHDTAAEGVVGEVVRQAELLLTSQLQAAVGADQRASALAGVLSSTAVAAFGGSAALLTIQGSGAAHVGGYGLGIAAICLASSAFMAVLAARPVTWYVPGNWPRSWKADAASGKSLTQCMAEVAAYYDPMIEKNLRTMERAAKWFNRALWCAVTAAPLGGAAAGAVYVFGGGAG